jgi:hypothetical protein
MDDQKLDGEPAFWDIESDEKNKVFRRPLGRRFKGVFDRLLKLFPSRTPRCLHEAAGCSARLGVEIHPCTVAEYPESTTHQFSQKKPCVERWMSDRITMRAMLAPNPVRAG